MALSLNKPKLDNLADEIWKSAERLRGKFKAYEYQSVVLPIIVIRRLECVLMAWRENKRAEVLKKRPNLEEKELAKLVKGLETGTAPFSNETDWTLRRVYEEDHTLLEEHFRDYINGFSRNVDDIIEHFNYRATIGQMVKNNRLAPILNQYKELELGPDKLSPLEMGYVYEELLRRFSEQSGEEAGEHFTPREVIRLMVELLEIPIPDRHISIYDPACGTGGMLSVAKEHLLDRAATPAQKADVEKYVTVHGQELSPTNYAICQADLLIKNDRQAKVYMGNSLIPHDRHGKEPGDQPPEPKNQFDFMLSNPPFGVTWGGKDGYETEARKLKATRYRAGMPRVNDGALHHKVSVVFWQFDEHDQPATVTEPYEKAFTAANLKKEQEFYASDLKFCITLKVEKSLPASLCLWEEDPSLPTRGEGRFSEKLIEVTLTPNDNAVAKFKALMEDKPEIVSVEWTHRHYVKDDEYIPHGEDIATFLKREIAKPIIRWDDSPQLGYEILPNKYFYRYQPPRPAQDLLAEFWRLEKEAEKMLEGLGK